jgi:hypothetical protein
LNDRFRAPTELELAFLRAVTDGYPELREQIESCLVADYDPDGYCDVQILGGPPTPRRMAQYEGPSLVSDIPDSPLVDTILWVDQRGFLDNVEIVDYGARRDDAYQRFVTAAAESRLTYHVDR